MSDMNIKNPIIETAAFVQPRKITRTDDFKFRTGKSDRAHVKTILNGMNIRGDIVPILLWKESIGCGGDRLILIDGQHRLEAFAVSLRGKPKDDLIRKRGIPAIILECDFAQAMQRAIVANTNDSLPLSPSERANAAWKLVRMFGKEMSKAEISKTATVGTSTVHRMRTRWNEMTAKSIPASGYWNIDRQGNGTDGDRPSASAEELEAEIEALHGPVKRAFAMNPKRDAKRDAEVLRRVHGTFYLKQIISELLATRDEPSVEAVDLPGEIETGTAYASTLEPAKNEFAY